MDGDETKIKVAYIKRRAEKLIASEKPRIQAQLRRQEGEQKAARIAEFELQTVAESAGVTIEQAEEMLRFKITKQGDSFSMIIDTIDWMTRLVTLGCNKSKDVTRRIVSSSP